MCDLKLDFMLIALRNARFSTCLRRKVAAALVSADWRSCVFSVNYPRPYKEICRELGCLRDQYKIESGQSLGCCRCRHCEQEVIRKFQLYQLNTDGAVLYTTLFPCEHCARSIISAGIRKIVFLEDYNGNKSERMLRKAKIIVERYQAPVSVFSENPFTSFRRR